MEGVMAVVTCFAGDFAPKFWAFCNGQLLSIATNQALFALLGNTYGGDGKTTFALPDLRGRSVVGTGRGFGLMEYQLGEKVGSETVVIDGVNIPPHTHNGPVQLYLDVDSNDGSVTRALNTYPALFANSYHAVASGTMASPDYEVSIGSTGGTQPTSVLMPYTVVNYIICLQGIFPSRN